MGLKSGSRDAGLDDPEGGVDHGEHGDTDPESSRDTRTRGPRSRPAPAIDHEAATSTGRPTIDSIPYKLRRDKVNEGREQVPFFLREEVIDAGDDLHDALEDLLGEDVFKSDYREAAMIVAQRNPDLVAAVLREWGYDLDAPG